MLLSQWAVRPAHRRSYTLYYGNRQPLFTMDGRWCPVICLGKCVLTGGNRAVEPAGRDSWAVRLNFAMLEVREGTSSNGQMPLVGARRQGTEGARQGKQMQRAVTGQTSRSASRWLAESSIK